MSARLFLRPGRQDHKVLADLLAPGGAPHPLLGERLLGGVVIDATMAEARPQFAEAAAGVGIPALVDPLTFFLQDSVREGDSFEKLPYGQLAGMSPDSFDLDQLVDSVLEFQVSSGATTLVVPYFHVTDVEGGWAALNLDLPRRAAHRAERLGVNLPAIAVLSGARKALSAERGLAYVDAYLNRCRDAGAQALGICGSPAGKLSDSYDGVSRVVRLLRQPGPEMPIIAWRQGAYGAALVALGAAGYECGMGAGETTDIAAMQARRRPRSSEGKKPFSQKPMVYFETFGRSLQPEIARALLTDPTVQGELVCDLPGCCASVEQTMSAPRPHAVQSRAMQLRELNAQPARWRLQHQLRRVEAAIGTAQRANEVLSKAGLKYRVSVPNMRALADVLRFEAGTDQAA